MPETFDEHASRVREKPGKTVERYATVANDLGDEVVGLMVEHDAPTTAIEKLKKPNDDQQIHAASMISLNVNHMEAIAIAMMPSNATCELVGDSADRGNSEVEMTDEEWLEHYCGEVLGKLTYQDAYRIDAGFYRRTTKARQVLFAMVKSARTDRKDRIAGVL